MATQVRVQATKGKGKFMHGEVSGGSSGEYGEGSHDFKIGVIGSMVCFLTIKRLDAGDIKISAVDGALDIQVDGGKDKRIKKSGSFKLPSKASRAFIREKV